MAGGEKSAVMKLRVFFAPIVIYLRGSDLKMVGFGDGIVIVAGAASLFRTVRMPFVISFAVNY